MTDTAVSPQMRAAIVARLKDIEAEEQVRILFAIESGSRAWGFHSPDSDYDVRFVYARPVEWHYRLEKTRDVIERPIDDELDISGWELGKALGLAMRSNAVIAEWLQSPITYLADTEAVQQLTIFARDVLDRRSVTWHYLALLERQRSRLAAPEGGIRIKRYFYVLRPSLALRWMRLNNQAMPPMDMATLRAGCDLSPDLAASLDRLTQQKMAAKERAESAGSDPLLDRFIAGEEVAARDWLSRSESRAQPRDWQAANALHMALSRRAG